MSGSAPVHIAIDLGASGGRVARGFVRDGRLSFDILHRFPNRAVPLGGHLYWNILQLWQEIRTGLRLAAKAGPVASVGATTWGVDYALLDADMQPIGMVHSHRDCRTEGIVEALGATMDPAALYRATGGQFLPINTLPQLVAARRDAPDGFARARHLLMLPDLLHYWLSGVVAVEHTNASTTQLYDPARRDWSDEVLAAFSLPRALFPKLVEPGTVLGPILPEIAADTGLAGAVVVAPATHDTASAIAAIPAGDGEDWAYVSSGTWCLAGIERAAPLLTDAAREANITNEQGVRGTTRLLKNTAGLFVLQECMRGWGDPPIEALLRDAATLEPGAELDVADPRFARAGADMPARIAAWCEETGVAINPAPAATARAILAGLARAIAATLAAVDRAAGHESRRIHVVGGGARIGLFNRMIAAATGLPVVAGPVEATTAGNLLVQAEALGAIPPGGARAVMRATVETETYTR